MREIKRLKITLETKTPFRIGGEKSIPGTTDVDSPITTVGDKIVVQGTSLKGAFRAELERYLIDTFYDKEKGQWKNEWLKPCIPADINTITSDEKRLVEKDFYKYCCNYPEKGDYICPVCYLLGARGLVGFLSVPFLYIETETISRLQFIRMDRVIGTSARGKYGALGKYEVIPDKINFNGTLIILEKDDILGWELGKQRPLTESKGDKWLVDSQWDKTRIVKELIEDRLKSIQFLGGFKSKGCGEVKIAISNS